MKQLGIFFVAIFILNVVITPDLSYSNPKYVGVEGCKCHKLEIADWERSKHAKAYNLLKPGKRKSKKKKAGLDPKKDYTRDEKCIKCHVTGYKEPGGYFDSTSTPAMTGVGCEGCHGPGEKYRILHKEKGLTFTKAEAQAAGQLYGTIDAAAACNQCHVHKDNPFKPEINDKYKFDINEALKKNRLFHDYYEMEGKH